MSDSIDRQKVLATLDFADNALDEERTVEKYKELLAECVKALPPTENKGDLISRQAVINAIANTIVNGESLGYGLAEEIVSDIPSVENKGEDRPKGRWIGHREHCENLGLMPSGLGAYEWCSNCDCGIDVREWHRNDYNYCPKCGADMRGEE